MNGKQGVGAVAPMAFSLGRIFDLRSKFFTAFKFVKCQGIFAE
jgi:hypothetical protein